MINLQREKNCYNTINEPYISFENVTKTYGNVTALNDLTVEFDPGTIHGLVGPNGSGKTTMFKLVLRLIRANSGTITAPPANNIGYSFQAPQFYPNLTAAENINVFTKLNYSSVDNEWVEEMKEILRINAVQHQQAKNLSGGFQKKLDILIGLLSKPDIVLLDEPLSDVDKTSREKFLSFIEQYINEERLIIISTHNTKEFEEMLTETVLFDGEIREEY